MGTAERFDDHTRGRAGDMTMLGSTSVGLKRESHGNVRGHIETNQKRLMALTRMRRLLDDDGVIFIDVNNRYNAVNYGVLPTIGRMLYDFIAPSETNGDAQVTWTFGEQQIRSPTHAFTPRGDYQAAV